MKHTIAFIRVLNLTNSKLEDLKLLRVLNWSSPLIVGSFRWIVAKVGGLKLVHLTAETEFWEGKTS